jgi:general stress protein YciG
VSDQKSNESNESGKPKKKKRGFAAIPPERLKELSKRGGLAAHRAGKAHRFTTEEAREAGRKGGLAVHKSRGAAASSRKSS